MAAEQEWCLHCGASGRGVLRSGSSITPMAAVLAASALLVLGATAAAYAALSQKAHKSRPYVTIMPAGVQGATTPPPPAPAATVPTTAVPTVPPGSTSASSPTSLSSKPPKIPLATPTPNETGASPGASETAAASTPTAPTVTMTTGTTTSTTTTPPAKGATPILLDTDAASTYNPNGYPESDFGDPALVIDGDNTTAWTAKLPPASPTTTPTTPTTTTTPTAPSGAGLLINLKGSRHLGKLALVTPSVGMTIQVYGTAATQPLPPLSDPAWVRLSPLHTVKKKHATIKLREAAKQFRFVVLLITSGPSGASTPANISVNELMLFSPRT